MSSIHQPWRFEAPKRPAFRSHGSAFFLAVMFLFVGQAAESWAAEGPGGRKPAVLSGYRFHHHLEKATAWVQSRRGEEWFGDWRTDRILFPHLGPRSEIREVLKTTDQGTLKSIRFNPLPEVKRYLKFMEVPPGREIIVFYQMESERSGDEIFYVNFKIWIGRHLLKHIRMASGTKESRPLTLPLGIASMLDRPLAVTFEVSSDSVAPLLFNFAAEVR